MQRRRKGARWGPPRLWGRGAVAGGVGCWAARGPAEAAGAGGRARRGRVGRAVGPGASVLVIVPSVGSVSVSVVDVVDVVPVLDSRMTAVRTVLVPVWFVHCDVVGVGGGQIAGIGRQRRCEALQVQRFQEYHPARRGRRAVGEPTPHALPG